LQPFFSRTVFDTYTDIFAERARDYHQAMTSSPRARDAEFRAMVEPIAGGPQGLVCDIPSGGCYLPRYLPEGMRYIGVEPVDDFLNSSPPSCDMLKAPFDDIPLPGGTVDYVVSLAGLHHEERLPPIFAEMRRLLRRGGRAVIADVAVDTPPAGFLNGFVARHNPLGHDGRFLDRETKPALEAADIHVVDDQIIDVPWAFGSFDEAAAFCGKLFGIASAGRKAILDALTAEIGFTEEDGRIHLRWRLRRIVGEAV
jgi:SAM-dependent methyltransferase